MPIERLEKLFGEVGEAAQRLAQLKAQAGAVVMGGVVAQSENVKSIQDLYAQIKRTDPAAAVPKAARQAETLAKQREEITRALVEALRKTLADNKPESGRSKKETQDDKKSLLQRIPPVSWVEAGLHLAKYVEQQDRAGRAVDVFTRALAVAARFLYSMTTGKVITRSGQTIPWRRAAARALRRVPAMRSLRRMLMLPDLVIRPMMRHMAKSGAITRTVVQRVRSGRRPSAGHIVPQVARTAGIASRLARTGQAATGIAAGGARGAAAAGTAARLAAGAGQAAASGATGAAASGATGAAAGIGAAALAAAGPVGVVVGAVIAFTAVLIGAVVALRKFTVGVKESTERLLGERFMKYAAVNPTIAAAQARLEAYEIGSKIRYGQATAGTTMQLTQAFIKLREEMGPLNRTLLNVQTLAATLLVHVARGVNLLLKMTAVLPLIDWLVKKLGGEAPKLDMPVETLLRGLEGLQGNRPRNPPPQGGLPPWP